MRKTRFPELNYDETGKGLWRIMDDEGATIGPHYASKSELLADLERYASDYFGTPNPRMVALQARLDEAVELLREASDVINLPWHDARRAFLSRINADGGVK